ncbi:MAG: hypothetical protein RIR18_2041, partial [Pseudomonadota bacterium]
MTASTPAIPLTPGPVAWGRTLKAQHRQYGLHDRCQPLPNEANLPLIPFGHGRSYGDVALNPEAGLLLTRGLDRFIRFDAATGVLRCEAGVLLDEILSLVVPQGWFLPVTPGTRFVTVGGAIANDVHGKNHHREGCFSRHVRALELLRSDANRLTCSVSENADWFSATCGGLGLTGLITWAELQLRRIANPWMVGFQERFNDLERFFQLTEEADRDYEYSVAWIDCASQGTQLGRGIFMAANHAPAGFVPQSAASGQKAITFPFTPPISLVNGLSLKAFNTLYFHRIRAGRQPLQQHYQPFFYPLDGILEWNRMYGPKGFHQYQCVVPDTPLQSAQATITQLLTTISESGQGSFLAVLKVCGDVPSPGLLSFPLPGVSLALDFPERGPKLHQLFEHL